MTATTPAQRDALRTAIEKATQRPWRLGALWDAPNGGRTVHGPCDEYVADVYAGHGAPPDVSPAGGEANAEAITLAVNLAGPLLSDLTAAETRIAELEHDVRVAQRDADFAVGRELRAEDRVKELDAKLTAAEARADAQQALAQDTERRVAHLKAALTAAEARVKDLEGLLERHRARMIVCRCAETLRCEQGARLADETDAALARTEAKEQGR